MMDTLLMHSDDDTALALRDLPAGHVVVVDGRSITLRQPVPCGHKIALRAIARGEQVRKYGQPIGRATADITPGEHVHTHNLESLRGRGDLASSDQAAIRPIAQVPHVADTHSPVVVGAPSVSVFGGYRRKDGRVGVRNHVLVLATVGCANAVVDHIGQKLPEVVSVSHVYGCSQIGDDLAQSRRVLQEFAMHPNVGAVLLVGLGCETMPTAEIAEQLAGRGVVVQKLIIQDEGGSRATAARGLDIARELLQQASSAEREPIPLAELIMAVECGGSDAWSGITANPAVGAASDLVVQVGGTVMLSEVTEFIGAEHFIAARAINPRVGQQVVDATLGREQEAGRMGVDMRGSQPTPGNMAGGLTTIEEKSLGAILKGGSTPVREFVPYAQRPTQHGLVVMDTPGNDIESVTAMVAGGAQVVVFTTGRGSPTGCPIAPVIKVATNSVMYRRLRDDMDVDAGTILSAGEPVASVGQRVFDEIVAAANGKQMAAETWGHKEFAISAIGPRL